MMFRWSLLRGARQAAPVAVLRTPVTFAPRNSIATAFLRAVSAALLTALPALVHAAAAAGPAASAVASAAADLDSEDIRDIRGPKFLLPSWFWYAVAAGVILIGLIIYGIIRWRRSRRRERVLTHFELALKRLEEIRALMQPPKAREFSIAVSDIVRQYIEQRFNATATHRTTEEFLHDLLDSSNPTLAKHRPLLSDFLHQCDLVKFAGMSLTTRNMESLHQSAEAFVLETAKPDEPPKPAAGSANALDSADPTQPIDPQPGGAAHKPTPAPKAKAPTAP
jgi:hypothetical protein